MESLKKTADGSMIYVNDLSFRILWHRDDGSYECGKAPSLGAQIAEGDHYISMKNHNFLTADLEIVDLNDFVQLA